MKKENLVAATVREPTTRVTRARAAASQSSEGLLILGSSKQQGQKRDLRKNSKRVAVDENNSCAPTNQHKRRAVLKDVSNVCLDNSNTNCANASKITKKNVNQIKRGVVDVSKVASPVAVKVQQNPKTKTGQVVALTETETESTGSWLLDKNAHPEPIAEKDLSEDIPLHDVPESGVPLNKEEKTGLVMLTSCSKAEFIDIDADYKDPQLCRQYAQDIYSNLRVAELMRRPDYKSMEIVQQDITKGMRGILVDWLVEVSEEYRLVPDTLYLTVHLIDLFLSEYYIERKRLQLLGITCMLIASKYEEICAPRIEEFCFITDNTYSKTEVLAMESNVLKDLRFRLSAPTTKTFLRRFLRAAQVSYKSPSLELEFLSNYLAELTLVDNGFLKFIPSIVAASAVFLAKWTLDQSGHPWNPTLKHYTSYVASDLKAAVLEMQILQLNTSNCPLNAICAKYKQDKFKSVSSLSSPKLLETLF
ncbi:Cyclin N-terminal domain-containing protein [Heracleum sosnowskyi]|uniref:Cyclin N-terminal domain-containing protein n=1 Tax=Heracleum sosnowskyi TaxID=360622 RepID=A0AAD8I0W2_9APIA|nr:Cyclin N-terminal domain-containing protein [Heracleum sosnowskyi]